MMECRCCGVELYAGEINEGQKLCFPCIKGNCEICKRDVADEDEKEDE